MSTDKASGKRTGKLNRREFLTASATAASAAAFGLAAGPLAQKLNAAQEVVTVNNLPGVVLGRTGFQVTRIAFGGILVTEPPVLLR